MPEAKKGPSKSKKEPRALSVAIPRDGGEVGKYIEQIAETHRAIQRLAADYEAQITKLETEAQHKIELAQADMRDLFDAIHVYADENRTALTAGGGKTITYPAGDIGWRFTPESVTIRNEKRVIEEIKALGLARKFIRIKEEVNKEAMLADQNDALRIDGVKISKTEQFVLRLNILDVEIADPPTKKGAERKTKKKKA